MHRQHRERFLEILTREGAAAVVATGAPAIRNHDSEYRFRPGSDFWYLTGFHEPDAVLVLAPRRDDGRAVLFLNDRNPDQEVWTGRRLGVDAAPETLGIDQAYPIESLWDELPDLLAGHEQLVHAAGLDEERDRRLQRLLARLRRRAGAGLVAPLECVDPRLWLHELRLTKSAVELEHLRRAAEVSVEAHLLAMQAAQPGANEAELDALLDYTIRRRGCTGSAYTNIVAGGANACTLHYVANDQPLVAGELILIDAGAEGEYYASDVTRTFPIDGTFSGEQKALYEVVLAAQKAAIERVVPGSDPIAVHETARDVIVDGLSDLGLLTGDRDEIVEAESYRRFFMHKTGHWLGLDVHDCGAYFVDGESRRYEPGMVTTVEPGIYIAPDDETVEARWRGMGIRLEDDVAVTAEGNEVLTARLPKEIEEVEAACRGAELQPAG